MYIISSTTNCQADDYSDISSLVESFLNTINSTKLILEKVTLIILHYLNEEVIISADTLVYTPQKQTSSSLIYELTNNNTFPIKCYKLISTTGRTHVKEDLSFILKSNSTNVFTETLSNSNCNS